MRDQRSFQRFDIDAEARGGCFAAPAFLDNLSYGGMGVRSSRPLPVGSEIACEMVTAFLEKPLAVKGIVRHAGFYRDPSGNGYRIGIEFTDINKDAVVYLIGRIQSMLAEALRVRTRAQRVDFLPY